MYELKNEAVDLENEAFIVIHYLQKHWDLPDLDIEFMVFDALTQSEHDARAWFSSHHVCKSLHEKLAEREKQLRIALPDPDGIISLDYDSISRLLKKMASQSQDLCSAGRDVDEPWDFEARASSLLSNLIERGYSAVEDATPKGWAALKALGESAVGNFDLDDHKRLSDAFKGPNTAGSSSRSFPECVSPSWILYDEQEHGRRPAQTLVGAIYAHFLSMVEHNNTVEMRQAIDAMDVSQPLSFGSETTSHIFAESPRPILSCLVAAAVQGEKPGRELKADIEREIASKITFDALPPDAKAAEHEQNRESIEGKLKALVGEALSGEIRQSRPQGEGKQMHVSRLQEAFAKDKRSQVIADLARSADQVSRERPSC